MLFPAVPRLLVIFGSLTSFAALAAMTSYAPAQPFSFTAAAKKTTVQHSLHLALTNTSCDTVLSPAQCFEFLISLEAPQLPEFKEISSTNWPDAIAQIDNVLNPRVSADREPARWKAIRVIGIQARQVIARLNDLRSEVQVPERQAPESLGALNLEHGITKVEIVHRLLVSGDRLLVDHTLIDRTPRAANDSLANSPPRVLAKTLGSEVTPEITASLGTNIARTMRTLGESVTLHMPTVAGVGHSGSPAVNRRTKTD